MSILTALLQYIASMPRPVLLIVAAAVFGTSVRWRWRLTYAIDAALIALAIERLSIGLVAWAAALIALRHVPAFAIDIAKLFDVASYDGWTRRAGWLLLPGADPSIVMSRSVDQGDATEDAVLIPTTAPTIALQPIVTPNSEYSDTLSDSARVQFDARAKTIAELYKAGIVTNMSKAICRAYGCSVQAASKPDSTYQLALTAVNKHLTRNKPQFKQGDGTTAPASHPITS